MNRGRGSEAGFALLFILVLMLVVTVSVFLMAGTTRVDTQIVNTIRNERMAFYAAEAGIAEAQLRLSSTAASTVNPSGVGSFDASFTGTLAPDPGNPAWNAEIVFTSAGAYPSKSGNRVTTPSIQPAASRIAYSTTTPGDASNLRAQWSLCTAVDAARGCSAVGAIRTIGGQNVLQVTSIGRSGTARRQLLLDLVVNSRSSAVVLRSDICPGVNAQGSGSVAFPGGVTVNSTCATAVTAGGSSSITASGPIQVVGSGTSGTISPTPTTGAAAVSDPLASLAVPSFPSASLPVRNGTQALPVRLSIGNTRTLNPGVYYGGISIGSGGNVTMSPGVYVMAGGGFAVSANGQIPTATGVTIYNTCAPVLIGSGCQTSGLGAYGAISISANRPINMSAPTSGTYAGIVIFQARDNGVALSFTAGAAGSIDGLIYAPIAQLSMSGNADLLKSQLVVGSINLQGGPKLAEPTTWVNLGGAGGPATAVAWSDS